jgi:phosphate transport system permease protein
MIERSQRDPAVAERLVRKRYAAERRFRFYGQLAMALGVGAVVFLIYTVFSKGYTAFIRAQVSLEVTLDSEQLGVTASSSEAELMRADYTTLIRRGWIESFPEVKKRSERRELLLLMSADAGNQVREAIMDNPSLLGTTQTFWVLMSSNTDQILKGNAPRDIEESRRLLSDKQLEWLDQLERDERIRTVFNFGFFTNGDSRAAEIAGIGGAITGSFYSLLICFLLSFPMGVAAAIYLEEFAPKNRWTELIEVNINNLAAVPSIVFGLLGLAVLLNFFGVPRSTPLAGGMVLSLMTLPTIIIACRASLKAVPPSIREAALGMGASPVQVVLHHVLPLAMPGTLTGTIIGLAQALGETAPLLMIGMFAFVADIPGGPLEAASALPVQIYLWAESSERGYVELTAAGIMVILVFLIAMNSLAVLFRKRFERRW